MVATSRLPRGGARRSMKRKWHRAAAEAPAGGSSPPAPQRTRAAPATRRSHSLTHPPPGEDPLPGPALRHGPSAANRPSPARPGRAEGGGGRGGPGPGPDLAPPRPQPPRGSAVKCPAMAAARVLRAGGCYRRQPHASASSSASSGSGRAAERGERPDSVVNPAGGGGFCGGRGGSLGGRRPRGAVSGERSGCLPETPAGRGQPAANHDPRGLSFLCICRGPRCWVLEGRWGPGCGLTPSVPDPARTGAHLSVGPGMQEERRAEEILESQNYKIWISRPPQGSPKSDSWPCTAQHHWENCPKAPWACHAWGRDPVLRESVPVTLSPLGEEPLISSLNLPWHSFTLFPRVLSLVARGQRSAPQKTGVLAGSVREIF